METWRNITLALSGHNRRHRLVFGPTRCILGRVAALGLAALVGCASIHGPTTSASDRKSMTAESVGLVPLARTRVEPGRSLPPHVIHRLCPEYALIVVSGPDDWTLTCRRLGLPAKLRELNLGAGPVVGVLADLGEKADEAWPLRIVAFETVENLGTLRVTVAPGLYYPLKTAGYLELAQLRGRASVQAVQINARTFAVSGRRQ